MRNLISFLLPVLGVACAMPGGTTSENTPTGDPRQGEVPLPCAPGWNAALVLDNRTTGVWTVKPFPVFTQYACPEVVGLDDAGRCHVVVSYSGKWTPVQIVHDGKWLGGLAHGDVDPRIAGKELYTGGRRGHLYQVVPHPAGVLDCRLVAHLPGHEIHTVLAGDVDAAHPGAEVVVFTRPGALYRVMPTGEHGTFETKLLQRLPGRVRDALVLPGRPGDAPEIATVSRAGSLDLLTLSAAGPRWTTVYRDTMGMGRIALRPAVPGQPTVVYSTHDDGRILRHVRSAANTWTTDTIHRGAQGPRGVAAGRFDADSAVETVAVFGYSKKVELLSNRGDGWRAETVFTDRGKGHWLAVAELDGRNGTHELLACGYGSRIVLLSRPPGYGLAAEETNRR